MSLRCNGPIDNRLPVDDHRRVIAIDGPAAAGKSTVARLLADRLGALLFDTGALYRAVALLAHRSNVPPGNAQALRQIAANAHIEVRPPSHSDGRHYDVLLDGEDVTWLLRTSEVGAIVSQVAEHRAVREALLPLQRRIAASGPVVMVGRDIGTVVVPDAGLKVYLDATPHERAKRRFEESLARGGREPFAEVLRKTLLRDKIDSSRETAPLKEAPDAIHVDTDNVSVEEVVSTIEALARAQGQGRPDGEPLWPS
jgi:cytidylate kinase